MKEDENIATFMLWVNEVVNHIQGPGETLEEKIVVKKVLTSLPRRLDPNFFAIQEAKDVNSLKLIELHGTLTKFQMIFESEDSIRKESSFRVSMKQVD